MAERLLKWSIFSITLSLLPLAFTAVQAAVRGKPITLTDVTEKGEVVLVAAVLCATSLGEVFIAKYDGRMARLALGGFAVLIIVAATWAYGDISSAVSANQTVDKAFICSLSKIIFGAAVLGSLSCEVFAG